MSNYFIDIDREWRTQSHIGVCERCLKDLKDYVEKNECFKLTQTEFTPILKEGDKCDICGFPQAKETFTFQYIGTFGGQSTFNDFIGSPEIVSRRAHNIMNKKD